MIRESWIAISKAALSPVLRWLPGWILRRWYPVPKCQQSFIVEAHEVGPNIYINAERTPAIVGLSLTFFNGLPFPVKVEGFHLDFFLDSHTLTSIEQAVNETIPAAKTQQKSVNEIHLTDGQARIVRQLPGDCPILSIMGHVSGVSVVGEFRKNLQIQTRAFIFRGGTRQ